MPATIAIRTASQRPQDVRRGSHAWLGRIRYTMSDFRPTWCVGHDRKRRRRTLVMLAELRAWYVDCGAGEVFGVCAESRSCSLPPVLRQRPEPYIIHLNMISPAVARAMLIAREPTTTTGCASCHVGRPENPDLVSESLGSNHGEAWTGENSQLSRLNPNTTESLLISYHRRETHRHRVIWYFLDEVRENCDQNNCKWQET